MRARAQLPVFVLHLQPVPGVNPTNALKRTLKFALRACGLKCIAIEQQQPAPRKPDNAKAERAP
jgi:hypothetical protein